MSTATFKERLRASTLKEHVVRFASLIWRAVTDFNEHGGAQLAAALAFYAVFSLAPLLVVAVAVVGFVFGDEAASGEVFSKLSLLLGPEIASIAEEFVTQASYSGSGIWATILGLGTLLYGSSKVFTALQDSLNMFWRVPEEDAPRDLKGTIKGFALSFALVPGFGLMFLALVVSTTLITAFNTAIESYMAIPSVVTRLVDVSISWVAITVMFGVIFKVLPNKKLQWRHVLGGASVTAALFVVGKVLIGLYLAFSTTGSVFGAAGTLAVLLMWFYFSSQIFFFGASLTHVWASRLDEEDAEQEAEAAEENLESITSG